MRRNTLAIRQVTLTAANVHDNARSLKPLSKAMTRKW